MSKKRHELREKKRRKDRLAHPPIDDPLVHIRRFLRPATSVKFMRIAAAFVLIGVVDLLIGGMTWTHPASDLLKFLFGCPIVLLHLFALWSLSGLRKHPAQATLFFGLLWLFVGLSFLILPQKLIVAALSFRWAFGVLILVITSALAAYLIRFLPTMVALGELSHLQGKAKLFLYMVLGLCGVIFFLEVVRLLIRLAVIIWGKSRVLDVVPVEWWWILLLLSLGWVSLALGLVTTYRYKLICRYPELYPPSTD